jgi:hypothetical protein
MKTRDFMAVGVCLAALGILAPAAGAQTRSCNASQDAAVQCFVASALRTDLTSLRYGMTTAQFQAYGVAVSKIVQAPQDYLVLAGLSGAIADAMPPANADGSSNVAAQQAAVNAIVGSEIATGLVTLPAEVSEQQMKWFALDLVASMDTTNGIMLSPGFLLRMTDSYVVTATSGGVVNWTTANASLVAMVNSLSSAGLLKLPASVTIADAQTFAEDLAQAIYAYKVATGRTSL